jgi:hypothetical protein
VKYIAKLYNARSRFVHQGDVIASDDLSALEQLARTVFFAAYRSQARAVAAGTTSEAWHRQWVKALDYVAACFDAGIVVDPAAVSSTGVVVRSSDRRYPQ